MPGGDFDKPIADLDKKDLLEKMGGTPNPPTPDATTMGIMLRLSAHTGFEVADTAYWIDAQKNFIESIE